VPVTNSKPTILILYDYFYPGFKAGGPVQSLSNLVISLEKFYTFKVITTAYDLGETNVYDSIKVNSWNSIALNGAYEPVEVWYADKKKPSLFEFKRILTKRKVDVIYVNGVYSLHLFIVPLVYKAIFNRKMKVVVCPRGMLQNGALAVKSKKKKYYIKALQASSLLKSCYWHATNEEEAKDISHYFARNKGITIASNIPKKPVDTITYPSKSAGELKLVFLSLITEKKNLHLLLQVLQQIPKNVSLDIYGPVKDKDYWSECLRLVERMADRVRYLGDVEPENVQNTFSSYHALILPTKGENFGHALYESLSVGRPIITSHFTPWKNLEEKHAGINVSIDSEEDCARAIEKLAAMDTQEYNKYCRGAHKMAIDYYNSLNPVEDYRRLFSKDE